MHQLTAVRAAAQQQVSLVGLKPKDGSKAAELKASISRLAGSKNGTDLAPEQHAEIKQLLQSLEAMNPADKVRGYVMLMLVLSMSWYCECPCSPESVR